MGTLLTRVSRSRSPYRSVSDGSVLGVYASPRLRARRLPSSNCSRRSRASSTASGAARPGTDHAPTIEPGIQRWLGFLPFVSNGAPIGIGFLLAGFILFIMILPTMAALSRDVIVAVPEEQTDGARALGATRWQATKRVILLAARTGIVGAAVLAAGRALGETMAVTMVIGNTNAIPHSLLDTAQTMSSLVVNEFGEASDPIHRASLIALVLLLLLVAMLVNVVARLLVGSVTHSSFDGTSHEHPGERPVACPSTTDPRDIRASLRRRKLTSAIVSGACGVAVVVAVTPLFMVLAYTVHRGVAAWSAGFFTHSQPQPRSPGGVSPTRSSAPSSSTASLRRWPSPSASSSGSSWRIRDAVRRHDPVRC